MAEIWFPNLGIKISKLNKIAFSILGFDIYWYGIIIATSILIALFFVQKEAKRLGQDPNLFSECLVYAIIVSLIFARIYYVIFSWDEFKYNLKEIFLIRNGGIAIYGGIIGGALTIFVYTKIKKVKFFEFTDIAVFGLIIGQIIGRWGNFFNREAFGSFTNSIFAMRYLKSQVNQKLPQNVLDNLINVNGIDYIQVHPTFLYESIWNLFVFLILLFYRKNKKFSGEITALYFILYGLGRVWIESLRTDALLIGNTNIAVSQLLSLILIIIFSIFIIMNKINIKKKGNSKL